MSKLWLLFIFIAFVFCTSCSNEEHAISSIIEGQLSIPATEIETSPSAQPVAIEIHDVIHEIPFVKEHHIDVPAFSQYPEYVNGCEITSLAMLSNYMNLPFDRLELIKMLVWDETPLQQGQDGSIEIWGNPDQGFVGDITGSEMGYGVYHSPIKDLLSHLSNGHAVDLTGNEFMEVEKQVSLDHPVIIWTTSSFAPVNDWVQWKTKDGSTIHATFEEHVVLLVGYDEDYVYVNNPLNGKKAEKIEKQPFIESWNQLGKQAVTYVP